MAIRELGASVDTVFAYEGTTPIAKVQVVTRQFGPLNIAWLPRGPVWAGTSSKDRSNVVRELPNALDTRAIWVIAPETPEDAHYFPHTALMSSQHVAEIDLKAGPDTLLAAQHGKWRNRLRRAQNADLRVMHRPFKTDRDMPLLIHEATQRMQRQYKALPPGFIRAWVQANPKASRLFTIFQGEKALAYLLILLHKPVATYHIGWTGADGRRLSAHNLGLWEAMNWLSQKGYERFDLGSVDTQHAAGLARFKIGSGANVRPLGPTCLHLPRLTRRRRIRHDAA
ncbi:GNAT family N-acetyltransferase [uncultured Roseovarius sp.]|uniref:GNAT family N-acetyltransferase n=1 Tax=uncultured Roseovarius sp. TaxID=293344 RepID=UPI00263149EE|nr:GNAT family N-acetyltransferase [uncultured Roseovarius sp.]